MYGWINECVKCLVLEKFGPELWASITAEIGESTEFVRYEYYEDSTTFKLVGLVSEKTGLSAETVLETFGGYFIQFTKTQGYNNLLECMGGNLMEWLSNVDMLHRHLSSSLPNMKAPHFRCTSDPSDPFAILLYYQSPRGAGLEPIVVGVVKEIAKTNFKIQISFEQIATQNKDEGVDYTCWRIKVVAERLNPSPSNMSSPPPDFGQLLAKAPGGVGGGCPMRGSHGSPLAGLDSAGVSETQTETAMRAAMRSDQSTGSNGSGSGKGLLYRRIKVSERFRGSNHKAVAQRLQLDRSNWDSPSSDPDDLIATSPTGLTALKSPRPKHIYADSPDQCARDSVIEPTEVSGSKSDSNTSPRNRTAKIKKWLQNVRRPSLGGADLSGLTEKYSTDTVPPENLHLPLKAEPRMKTYGLSSQMLKDLYSYHLVFNKDLVIVQCGKSLEEFLKVTLTGELLNDHFAVQIPFHLDSKDQWREFIIETEHNSLVINSKNIAANATDPLSLIGPVVFTENKSVAIFICVPNVCSLFDIRKQGLTVGDIPKNDFHLQMILLSEHLFSETESSYRLTRLSRELDEERTERMKAMQEAAAHAEASLATKKTFVRYVSHEIRTPLTVSKVGLDLLVDDLKDLAANETILSTATDCQRSIDVAVSILNDLLNYEKLEGGIMDLYKTFVPVQAFLLETLRPFDMHAKQKGVNYTLDASLDLSILDGIAAHASVDHLCILIDETKMSQVFRNLASNALKFTNPGGMVSVSLALTNRTDNLVPPVVENDQESANLTRGRSNITEHSETCTRCGSIVVKVIDNGAGIDIRGQSKIFNEIVQFSPNELQAGGGTGLGLWISKRICDLHESKILMTSAGAGLGSTFVVELPLYLESRPDRLSVLSPGLSPRLSPRFCSDDFGSAQSDGGDAEADVISPEMSDEDYINELSGLDILIVDDASMILKVVSRLLRSKGAFCETAEDGQQAISKINAHGSEFDAVLMDSVMPVLEGPEATKQLRASGYCGLIIGVTGNIMPQDIETFLEAGADKVLGKPLNVVELAKSIYVLKKTRTKDIRFH